MISNELISVIVPIYNVEKYLEKCLYSLIKQSYQNLQIILIDDGSTDASGTICDYFAEKDERIVCYHKLNGGLSSARNYGLKKVKGKYLTFVDSDDYVETSYIQEMYDALIKYSATICICDFNIVDESSYELKNDLEPLNTRCITSEEVRELLNRVDGWRYVVAWNKLIVSELFKDIVFPENRYHEDEYVIHYLVEKGKNTVIIRSKLYNYRQRLTSIMGSVSDVKMIDAVDALEDRILYYDNEGLYLSELKTIRRMVSIIKSYDQFQKSKDCKRYLNSKIKLMHKRTLILASLTRAGKLPIIEVIKTLVATKFSKFYFDHIK